MREGRKQLGENVTSTGLCKSDSPTLGLEKLQVRNVKKKKIFMLINVLTSIRGPHVVIGIMVMIT